MTTPEALSHMYSPEELRNKTYVIRLRAEHLASVTQTWLNITDIRPAIQLRDVKGSNTMFALEFVLTVYPPILPQHYIWLTQVTQLDGATTFTM